MDTIKATPKFSFKACPTCGEETPVIQGTFSTHGTIGGPGLGARCAGSGQTA